MNRRTWIASVGASLFATRFRFDLHTYAAPDYELVTSMPYLETEDPSDPYAFLDLFDQAFPTIGDQTVNDPLE